MADLTSGGHPLLKRKAASPKPEKSAVKAVSANGKNGVDLPDLPDIEKAVLQVIFAHAEQGFAAFDHSARKSFFVNPVNRELYNIARAFHAEQGRLDWIAFTQHLETSGRFIALGGHTYITDLFVPYGGVAPPLEMLPYYVDLLSDNYVRRQLIVRSFSMAGRANTGDIEGLLTDLASSADDLRRAKTGKVDLCDATLYLNGNCPPMPLEIVYGLLHQGSKMKARNWPQI